MAHSALPATHASRPPVGGGVMERHGVALSAALGLVLLTTFMVFSVVDLGGMRWLWDNVHWTVAPIVGLAIVLAGARTGSGFERTVRLGMAAVLGLWMIGQLLFDVYALAGDVPVPSLADPFFLGSGLPVAAVLIVTARRYLDGAGFWALCLDALAVTVAVVGLVVAVHPVAPVGAARWSPVDVMGLAYPVFFIAAAGVAFVGAITTRAELAFKGIYLVIIGTLAIGVCFAWWLAAIAAGSEQGGMLPGYLVTFSLILTAVGMATWQSQREARPSRLRAIGIIQASVPFGALIVAAAVLLIPDVPEQPDEMILKVCVVLTAVLSVARGTLLLREHRSMLAELQETHAQAKAASDHNRRLAAELQDRISEMESVQRQLIHASRQTAVGELASAIAHEVNNPLTGVLGYAELLLCDLPEDGRGREELETIRSEALRARKIVRSLVEFARPKAPEQAPANLNDIARVTVDLIRYHVERGGIDIRESYAELPIMTVDEAAVGQLLLNLLNNAVLSMPNGGTLRIATRVDDDHVAVSIADDGGGMDEATLGRIFEPFFTTRNLDAGHGLGLPVAMGIAEAHGGTIDVVSRLDHGTMVEVLLPLSLATTASAGGGDD